MTTNSGKFKKGQIPWNKGKQIVNKTEGKCLYCHKSKIIFPWMIKWKRGQFCNRACRTLYQKGKAPLVRGWKHTVEAREKIRLSSLGRKLTKTSRDKISLKNSGTKNGMYGKTHSNIYKQFLSSRRGEQTPNWKGGITVKNKLVRTSAPYSAWRKSVFIRDNFICQICFLRGGSLRANHIKRFIDYPLLRLEIDNGITICTRCDYQFVFNREKDWEEYFYGLLALNFPKMTIDNNNIKW